MNNLTLAGYVRPIASRNIGRYLIEYLTFSKTFAQELLPGISKESEELCSSAGVQGAGPLASAERADSPSAEGWREFQREEGNASQCMVPFLSLRIKPLRVGRAILEPGIARSPLLHPTGHRR